MHREPINQEQLLTVPRESRFATDIESNWRWVRHVQHRIQKTKQMAVTMWSLHSSSSKVTALMEDIEGGLRKGSMKYGNGKVSIIDLSVQD